MKRTKAAVAAKRKRRKKNCAPPVGMQPGDTLLFKGAKDGDGDGFVHDGTPRQRPVQASDILTTSISDDGVEMMMSPPVKKLASRHKVRKQWDQVRAVPAEKRHAISKRYLDMPLMDDSPETLAAWDQAEREIDDQFDMLTKELGITVEFVDDDPYEDFHQMYREVGRTGVLKVLRTASTGSHPYWKDRTNDRFRAIHDAFGHLGTGRGFDRHGEEAAYQAHISMFSGTARRALATELRGQNSTLIDTGDFAPQKIGFLPEELIKRLSLVLKAARRITADDDNAYSVGGSHHTSCGRNFAVVKNGPVRPAQRGNDQRTRQVTNRAWNKRATQRPVTSTGGQVTGAERIQRQMAAQRSAAKRRRPTAPPKGRVAAARSVPRKMVRPEVAAGARAVHSALDSKKPIKMDPDRMKRALVLARKQGLKVDKTDSGYEVTLTNGQKLGLETK